MNVMLSAHNSFGSKSCIWKVEEASFEAGICVFVATYLHVCVR